jgi:uncharacterized membrane protein
MSKKIPRGNLVFALFIIFIIELIIVLIWVGIKFL